MITIEQAIEKFLRDVAIGQSKGTVGTYSQGLKRFSEYLEYAKHSPTRAAASLNVNHALGFAQWISQDREAKIAKPTLRTYLASISRFYGFIVREEIIDLSATDLQRLHDAYQQYRRGAHRTLPKLPPENAVLALLAAARRAKPAKEFPRLELARVRNIAMLEALRSAGMRVGELVALKRGDLDYDERTARVTGKGDKQRIVYFDDAAWSAIQTYLNARQDGASGRAMQQLPLFARHDRRASKKILHLTTDSVRLVFGELARAAKLEITLTPHSMRHAFATRMLDSTGDLAIVQDMLGHASPTTTRIYAQVSSKRMRDAHRTAFGYTRKDKPG